MVYIIRLNVDGACRDNGSPHAIGAAAAIHYRRYNQRARACQLDGSSDQTPTSQRAELQTVILALEWAVEIYNNLTREPELDLRIRSDSRYAVGCLNEWVRKWNQRGWRNAKGSEIANRDLIEKAHCLRLSLEGWGNVNLEWVPRRQNVDADERANEELNKLLEDC
jgi:ribonuclease HI